MARQDGIIPREPGAGEVSRQGLASTELAVSGETVASVLAARAKAEIEARYVIAMRRPRDWDEVRRRLLDACERPGFAGSATEKVWGAAWYSKPIGEGVEGFSIRFAEEVLRCMGNLDARANVIWEDDEKRIVQVEVVDLESNISIPTTVVVRKTIERRFLRKGEIAISVRTNSRGEPVYLRAATDDEVLQMQNSAISKALRNGILRLLPGDIQAECRTRIMEIRHGDIARDPDGTRKKIVDAFAQLGVKPAELKRYLGHDIAASAPEEMGALRDLWKEIRDGNTTWGEVLAAVTAERDEEAPEGAENGEKLNDLAAKLRSQTTMEQPPDGQEETPGAAPPEEIPSVPTPEVEMFSIAREMWGRKYRKQLTEFVREAGYDIKQLTEEQAGRICDLLNERAGL